MVEKKNDIIAEYEVLFAVRTGVTILLEKHAIFDGTSAPSFSFAGNDLVLEQKGKKAIIKDLKKNYIEEIAARGSAMFYELEKEEVVRCTSCPMQGKVSASG